MELKQDLQVLGAPPQTDTVAWALLLVAARNADMIPSGALAKSKNCSHFYRTRKHWLLFIARALYDEKVRPLAESESRHIATYLEHCEWLHRPREVLQTSTTLNVEPWDREWCQIETLSMLVPYEFETLQLTSPLVIGASMLPWPAVWEALFKEKLRTMSEAEKRQLSWYQKQVEQGIRDGTLRKSAVQPLQDVRFVNVVLEWAPPMVRNFPSRWSAPEISDELTEALQALMNMGHTRPLAELVDELDTEEYRELVEEHWCLSQIVDKGSWAATCASERRLDEYEKFARLLRQDADFTGVLKTVPSQRPTRTRRSYAQSSSTADMPHRVSRFLTLSGGATAVSGVPIVLLAALGAVVALGLVLVIAVYRLRARRAQTLPH